jgi:MFS transporter, SHS family, sialic acid transporter
MGGEWALGVSLIMEVWPSKNRPVLAGLIGGAANVGFLVVGFMGLGLATFIGNVHAFLDSFLPAAWVDYLMNHDGWRFLCLMGATPALLTLFIQFFVPESEKWKHASKTATKKTGIADIFAPGILKHTVLGACLAGLPLLGTWGSVQWIPAWSSQLAEKQVKAANEAAPAPPEAKPGDAQAPAPPPADSLPNPKKAGPWAQIIIAIGAIIGTLVVAVLAEKFNRRGTYFGLSIASLVICQYMYRAPMEYGTYFLFIGAVANGLTAGFYGWLPLYLPELFPTRIRATGTGFSFNIGRVIASAGTISGGGLLTLFGGDYAKMGGVLTFVYVLMMVIIWFCPETKGKPLPE